MENDIILFKDLKPKVKGIFHVIENGAACPCRRFWIDEKNRNVICMDCETYHDSFDALLTITSKYDYYNKEHLALLEQIKLAKNDLAILTEKVKSEISKLNDITVAKLGL